MPCLIRSPSSAPPAPWAPSSANFLKPGSSPSSGSSSSPRRRSAGKDDRRSPARSTRSKNCKPEAFDGVDLAIASTPDDVARDFVPDAVSRGCVVIDESGYWRMDPKVPLVIPEVNAHAIRKHQGIIASPNCSTTQMVVALKPLHDAGRVRRVVVSTYQAVSGAGLAGSRDLENGTRATSDRRDVPHTSVSPIRSPSTASRRSARPSTRATPRKR